MTLTAKVDLEPVKSSSERMSPGKHESPSWAHDASGCGRLLKPGNPGDRAQIKPAIRWVEATFTLAAGGFVPNTASCPCGKKVFGGGAQATPNLTTSASSPSAPSPAS